MIKAKFGQRLRSKTLTAQINEALCKVRCHNLCVVIQSMHELNITPEFSNAAMACNFLVDPHAQVFRYEQWP